jgi:hypothetical protein
MCAVYAVMHCVVAFGSALLRETISEASGSVSA